MQWNVFINFHVNKCRYHFLRKRTALLNTISDGYSIKASLLSCKILIMAVHIIKKLDPWKDSVVQIIYFYARKIHLRLCLKGSEMKKFRVMKINEKLSYYKESSIIFYVLCICTDRKMSYLCSVKLAWEN